MLNRWFLGGVGFLIVLSVACVLWYQHDIADERKAAADAEELLRQSELSKETDTDSMVEPTSTDAPAESSTQTAEKHIEISDKQKTDTNKSEPSPVSTAIEPEHVEIADESPYGFGPYPEVPQDFIERYGPPIWFKPPENLPTSTLRDVELIDRVKIKKWIDGNREFTNGIYENGKIYLNYPNTFYVRYTSKTFPDGTHLKYISSVISGQQLPLTPEQLLAGEIPKGVNLIDMESQDVGIEPLSFLGLE